MTPQLIVRFPISSIQGEWSSGLHTQLILGFHWYKLVGVGRQVDT